ncbi:hypothetical protein ACFXTO_005163 [Malus domestica]
MIDSDDERSEGLTLDDIKEITIQKLKIANWFMEPFFYELIVGCFVRVGIGRSKSGPIYRLCMGNENSAARWQMAMISNSVPLEEEFKQWMIQEKKSASSRPLNIALEKDQLRRELEVAKSKQDDAEVERIHTRLQQLEARRQSQGKDSKAIRLAEMNRKKTGLHTELKPKNIGLKAGEAGYDPFSRRWTRSRNYCVKDRYGTAVVGAVRAGMAATAAALEAVAGAGKLIDTSAPLDFGTESNLKHNFELPVSLAALQKFGMPQGAQEGFVARKQRIEATVECRVPENDGQRHALTLSVSDYKR